MSRQLEWIIGGLAWTLTDDSCDTGLTDDSVEKQSLLLEVHFTPTEIRHFDQTGVIRLRPGDVTDYCVRDLGLLFCSFHKLSDTSAPTFFWTSCYNRLLFVYM